MLSSLMPVSPVQRVSSWLPLAVGPVAGADRVVELVLLGPDDDPVAGPLAEVDPRLGHLRAPRTRTAAACRG